MKPVPLTTTTVAASLSDLSAELSSESAVTARTLWPFLDAAAVLSTFEPNKLRPLGPSMLDPTEAVAQLLEQSIIVRRDDGRIAWRLDTDARRAALERLGTREAMQLALGSNERYCDVLQRALDDAIEGVIPPLETQSREELASTLQVARWFAGILEKVPDPHAVRQALDRQALTEPFQRLVGDHFAGRARELRHLRSYVDVLQTSSLLEAFGRAAQVGTSRPPLMIDGVGGVGKSTLVARFILDHLDGSTESELAFTYIDYDSPAISTYEPASVLLEAAAQLGAQYDPQSWRGLRAELSQQLSALIQPQKRRREGRGTRARAILRPEQRTRLVHVFAETLRKSLPVDVPWLLVLDTFEEVQYLGEEIVREAGRFLEELEYVVPELRTIIAGRAPVSEFKTEPLHLGWLDDDAAAGYLSARGVTSAETARQIVSRLGGNPLTLQLAARAVQRDAEEITKIQTLRRRRRLLPFLSVDQAEIQGYLYRRILEHVHAEDVKRLAHPGLVMRWISPEIIRVVLAGPCEVPVESMEEARRLFGELRAEVTLVRPVAGDVLEHRADVRRVMLPLIHRDEPQAAEAIHRAAVAYYSEREGIDNRAEEIYHRLFVDDLRTEVDDRWLPGVEDALVGALDELPPEGQVELSPRVHREPRDKSVWRRADAETQGRRVEARMQDLLDLGRPWEALGALARAKAGAIGARLRLLQASAQRTLGKLDDARGTVNQALDAIEGAEAGVVVVDLLALLAEIEDCSGNLAAARESSADAYRTARQMRDTGRQFAAGLRRIVLLRRSGADRDAAARELEEIEADAMDLPDEALGAQLPLARALAGELAPDRPRLLLRLIRIEAIPSVTSTEVVDEPEGLTRVAAALREANPELQISRRLASSVSASVQWPEPEVQQSEGIRFEDRGQWWTVYVSNAGSEPIWDVTIVMPDLMSPPVTFHLDHVQPGRAWRLLPRSPQLDPSLGPPRAELEFTAHGRRFREAEGLIEELAGHASERVRYPHSAAHEVAERLRVWVERPDAEVREVDRLDPSENWWVVYLSIDGDRPVHRVLVTVRGTAGNVRIAFPPVEPGRRRWWILRPDLGIDADAPRPEVEAQFAVLGYAWRRVGEELRLIEH